MKNLGIYIHIPYCVRKCKYCGFHSRAIGNQALEAAGAGKSDISKYINNLIAEIREKADRYRKDRTVDTVFIGGGTPSILPVEGTEAILGAVRESFPVASDAEITIEANPGTLDEKKLKRYLGCGINRLSLGIQSFDDATLTRLGRIHAAAGALESYEMARSCGFSNINMDLMFGIPGQTMETWKETLETAIHAAPEHISFYSLQIEEDTPFYDEYLAGTLIPTSDELDREMYHYAIRRFKDAGYRHYEISNAARPGFESRHNMKYWSMDEYLGIGESASSFVDGIRFTEAPNKEYHENTEKDNISEFLFTGLRKTDGVSMEEFESRFQRSLLEVYEDRWHHLEPFFEKGLLLEEGGMLKLSEEGIDISNQIMSIFV